MSCQTPTLSKQTKDLVHALGGGHPPVQRPTPHPELTLITLHLARCEDHPNGNRGCGYHFLAPLDDAGRLDQSAWETVRDACIVRRFRENEEDRAGHLVHRSGGRDGATWCFVYRDEIERGFNFQDHVFAVGEYVSVSTSEGLRPYRIDNLLVIGRHGPERTLAPAAQGRPKPVPEPA